MIYKQQSVSDKYFNLLLEEALKRDLNCRLIGKEILDFNTYLVFEELLILNAFVKLFLKRTLYLSFGAST